MKTQIFTLLRRGMALCLATAITAGTMAQSWVDVTDTYIVNPSYEEGTTGWTDGTAIPVVNTTFQNAEFFIIAERVGTNTIQIGDFSDFVIFFSLHSRYALLYLGILPRFGTEVKA